MNKLLLITILLIIFTGCHENQQWMSKEKSTARKSVLEMTTRSYTAGSSVFTEILPEGSEIGLFITYGNQDSLYKGASLYKNVKSKAVGSSKGSLKWKQTPQVFLRSNRPVMIYAYSPYKVQIPLDPTSIPIKISPIAAEPPSYEYGRLSQGQKEVNRKSPLAKLSMNYALSLLSFEIYQDSDINGLFKLTSIQIGNRAGGNTLQYTGTMSLPTLLSGKKKLRRSLLSMEELTNTSFRKAPAGIKDINIPISYISMVKISGYTIPSPIYGHLN